MSPRIWVHWNYIQLENTTKWLLKVVISKGRKALEEMFLIVQPRSVPASQALCRWVSSAPVQTPQNPNEQVANVNLGRAGQSERGCSLDRNIRWCQGQSFRGEPLSKALIFLSLSGHNSCSDGSVGALCNGPSYSSCSARSSYSLASLNFYFPKIEGVSKPQMFTKIPTLKC